MTKTSFLSTEFVIFVMDLIKNAIMGNKPITLAIHTKNKAIIMQDALNSNGIKSQLEKVDKDTSDNSSTEWYHVLVDKADISKALNVIESIKLFNYNDPQNLRIDDGRKRILVAIDFSEYSKKACTIAFQVAKRMDAKVKILHIYNNVYFPLSFPFADAVRGDENTGLLDKARKQILDWCLEIDQKIREGELPSVNYSYSIREGIPEEEIENFVKEYRPELLVLGTRGKDYNATKLVGDITADVIEMTNVPVLTVPAHLPVDANITNYHLVFLTNLNERDITSFDKLTEILKPYDDVKITLMHLNIIDKRGSKWNKDQLLKMKEFIDERYPSLSIQYKLIDTSAPKMADAISDFVRENKVSVVALNTRRRNMFGRMFRPSLSRKVLDEIEQVAIFVMRG